LEALYTRTIRTDDGAGAMEGSMSRVLCVFLGMGLLAACGGRDPQVDKTVEDGVEVVLNYREPYKIKGQPSTISLEEILSIDLESDDLATAGLATGGEWDVDDAGNIFVIGFKNRENFIYRFGRTGHLARSFGRRGQGPGELQWPFLSGVSKSGETSITDFGHKFIVYDHNGMVLREVKLERQTTRVEALENGKYLALRPRPDLMTQDAYIDVLTLCDQEFTDLKILDRFERASDDSRQVPYFMWRVSGGRIIIANQARGYEFWVYDLDGNPVRKIRKEYRPVRVTEEIKEAVIGPDYRRSGQSADSYFPNPLPPINQFFTDDKGRIFAMTYEPGGRPGEYLWDIFNPEGAFIGRKGLDIKWAGLYIGPHYTFIKNAHLYCHRVKQSGFHELVVYKVSWK
jgi:hypothetical protein